MPASHTTALITGASSGIGAVTALSLAKAGYFVKLVARNEAGLTKLQASIEDSGGAAEFMPADLTNEKDRIAVSQWISAEKTPIDVLINNAGLAWYGYAEELPWHVAREMLAVNMEAVVHLTSCCLPLMKSKRRGHIINISSIAGSIPSQGVALYSATKAFVDAFSTAIYRELVGTGVHMSVVRAGAVATPFFKSAADRQQGKRVPAQRFAIQPEVVAQRILNLIERPRRVIYVPRILRVVPLIELTMGWLMDRLGPLLLKRAV